MLVASTDVVVQGAIILLLANINIIIPNKHSILTKIDT